MRVFLFGALGAIWKKKHKMLTIDFEDEFGMIQSAIFEGEEMEIALEEIYNIRRMEKVGEPAKVLEPVFKKEPKQGKWQCPECWRINSDNAKFCTNCGEWKK